MTSNATATAIVFPGQGSQAPGMARAWQDHPAYERWKEADEVLRRDVSRLGLDADADELREPVNCQIALFVHHAVLLEAWTAGGASEPMAFAGHSLGEYDALLGAGVLTFADGLRLVEARANATQAAADARPGSMAACLGFEVSAVAAACEAAGAFVANDNAPGQVVVSGSIAALAAVEEALAEQRGKVRRLEVGAAYHSPHMEPAVEPFGAALDAAEFRSASAPVLANVDAQPHVDAGEWPALLRRQLTTPVRWRETVDTLTAHGCKRVVELAATPVLTGMIKRIDPALERVPVAAPEDLP